MDSFDIAPGSLNSDTVESFAAAVGEVLDVPNAYHEALQETDDIVSTVVGATLKFVKLNM